MTTRAAILALAVLAAHVGSALADDGVKLFKLISQKDDVVFGLTKPELQALGAGEDLAKLAKRLAADGQMTVWLYAVRKDQGGNLQQAPLKRIAIFRNDTLRIEPYSSPLAVVPPAN